MVREHGWIVIADSPFLPARGGGEREHLGFVSAAAAAGRLSLLVVPSSTLLPLASYREVVGDTPIVVTRRRENALLLAHPVRPYVVSSRPVRKDVVQTICRLAPEACGVVVFSYKSWRIGEAVANALDVPAVLRQHNLEGAYHRSLAQDTSGPRGLVLRLEAHRIERDERRLERASWLRAVADISATDAETRRQRGSNAVHVPPFAHDAALLELSRTPGHCPRALFIGSLDVATNTAALDWFLGQVWRQVRARVPHAALDVVGRRPTADLRRRLLAQPGVQLHADVPDIRPFLASASVAVNPTVSGSGVNIKLVDYLQSGVPVVTTTHGVQGLGLVDGEAVLVRDDAGSFAQALVDLLGDPGRAEALGRSGRERIGELLDPATNLRRLDAALSSPAQRAPEQSAKSRSRKSLTVQVEGLDELSGPGRPQWDALHESQVGVANPFMAPEWVEGWYRHFTQASDRRLLTVRRGSDLLGVAPFFAETSKLGRVTRLRLVGAGQGGSLLETPQVLAAPHHEREVMRAVIGETMTHLPGRHKVDWNEVTIPVSQGWFEPEWVYSTGQPVSFYRPQLARASVVLPLEKDWESLHSGFKRNLKESLRRSRNRLAKDGRTVEVVAHTHTLDDTAVEGFLDLHQQRATYGASVVHGDSYADAGRRAFLHDVLPRLGRRGRATLLELHLDGQPVAVQLALHAPGVTYLHSSGLRPEAWVLGPITFLQEQLVRAAVERGDRWVNFSPGPNVAKLRWSEQVETHQDFAYGAGPRSLQWKHAGFAAVQAVNELRHAVSMAGTNAAPGRTQATPGDPRG